MKTLSIITLACFLIPGSSLNAQNKPAVPVASSLNGKIFYVATYDVNHPDKKEGDTLSFANGKLNSNSCKPYGFHASPVSLKTENGKTTFSATCHSDKEGEINWSGTVTGNAISGTYLWHKDGQADIKYAYNGVQKK